VGPAFQWNLLNYGRIRNNVRFQDALFRQLVAAYQNAVLQADLEVENGIINFLQSQERAKSLNEAVLAAQTALDVVVAQYQAEVAMAQVDFNRYTVIVQTLIQQQDQWAQARGQIAQGLIETYRALGGGWQLRLGYAPDKRGILSADAVLVQPEGVAAPAGEALPLPAAP
jgi:outer membrane protein TolC